MTMHRRRPARKHREVSHMDKVGKGACRDQPGPEGTPCAPGGNTRNMCNVARLETQMQWRSQWFAPCQVLGLGFLDLLVSLSSCLGNTALLCVPRNLAKCLEYNRSSINIYWINEWKGPTLHCPILIFRKFFRPYKYPVGGNKQVKHRIILIFGSRKVSMAKPKIIGSYLFNFHTLKKEKKMPIKVYPVNALIFCQWAGITQDKEGTHL